MLLQELIDVYEELKKYVYVIERGKFKPIIIRFNNSNFYHLIGLHKTNVNIFFPKNIKLQDKRYKYMKKNVEKFNSIILDQIRDKDTLELRVKTFSNILNLLKGNGTCLYDTKKGAPGSMYDGDYALHKNCENIYCVLGLKEDPINGENTYAPISWMASTRPNKIISNKPSKYFDKILAIPITTNLDDE